ncbi:nicotinate phosphoribosyltransferase [Neolewinella xylanilytica]|uniref:Nicotinate phosphoribosyltransferase n=1 Tax=Neolewinella xylanilytica TaxID=1514080 RepID=A0A2S6I9T0_9BACT|nr:nicotinate phosphoribosyltransferase [Neolewinella xylanilytica]PPK88260.1 nicotinate phosphoribosyltransferase [Neolewinella xylanilytica]
MALSHLSRIYRPQFGLLTDLYELTMAAGYYDQGIHERRAIFHLFYRTAPFDGRIALAAGLPLAIDLIENYRFDADDIQYLGRLKSSDGSALFKEPFLNYLQRMRWTGDLDAIPEGEIVLPNEPLLRIEGPLIMVQLLETALLTVMNFSTLVATKAARIKAAAGNDTVLEFGLRRAQGLDGGLTASRSAYLGGCDATSNVWAGRYYNIPVRGTHAHSWVMVFPDELTAFDAYAEALPANCIFLVDTYDTLEGTRNAIRVGNKLRERGHEMNGIRLDSGDLGQLSIEARKLLDEAGFPDARIVASDSLDEYAIRELKAEGAKISIWGIGTRLVTGHDQAALGGVYKLSAIQDTTGNWQSKIKRSETAEKSSNPGKLAIRRYYRDEQPVGSQLFNELSGEPGNSVIANGKVHSLSGTCQPALQPVYRNGSRVSDLPDLHRSRALAQKNWSDWERIDWNRFRYGLSPELEAEKAELLRQKA